MLNFAIFVAILGFLRTGCAEISTDDELLSYFTKTIHHEDIHDLQSLDRRIRSLNDDTSRSRRRNRLNDIQHAGFSAKQRETETSLINELQKLERRQRWTPPSTRSISDYSLYNGPLNYGANQMQYVNRKLHQVSSTTRQNSVSVDSLIRWKSTTQQRIERLELMLENAAQHLPGESGTSFLSSPVDADRQVDVMAENSRQIHALQQSIANLQRTVHNLQSIANNRRSSGAVGIDGSDFEETIENSDAFSNQRDDVIANTRSIQSVRNTVASLQRTVGDLQSSLNSHLISSSRSGNRGGSSHGTYNSYNAINRHLTLDGSSDVTSLLRNHESRLDGLDEKLRRKSIDITSLQHQLMRLIVKGKQRDDSIRRLNSVRSNTTNHAGSTALGGSTLATSDGGATLDITGILKKLGDHEKKINNNRQSVEESRTCCLRISAISRRMDTTMERVNEARTRADESAVSVRVQKRKTDEMTNKMALQRIVIKRLQDTIISQQRGASRLNINLLENIRVKVEEMNSSISVDFLRKLDNLRSGFSSDVSDIRSQVIDNTNNLESIAELVAVEMQRQVTSDEEIRRHLDYVFPQHVKKASSNNSEVLRRLNLNGQSIFGIMTRLDEIRDETTTRERAIDIRVSHNRKSIESLETSFTNAEIRARTHDSQRNSALEETVVFLNTSYHHIRSAVQRQSNRGASLSSQFERLVAADRRTKERLAHLQELFEEHIDHSSNETMGLRYMITSDTNSLRRTVGSRFDVISRKVNAINGSTSRISSELMLLSDTVAGIAVDNTRAISQLETKTDQIVNDQEELTNFYIDFEEKTENAISKLNESIPEDFVERLEYIEEFDNLVEEQIARLDLHVDSLTRNATIRDSLINVIRRSLIRMTRHVNAIRHAAGTLERRATKTEESAQMTNATVNDVAERLGDLKQEIAELNDMTSTNRLEMNRINSRASSDKEAFTRAHNATRMMLNDMKSQYNVSYRRYERRTSGVNDRMDRLTSQVLKINEDLNKEKEKQNNRLMPLESLNSTLRGVISSCMNNIQIVESSVKNLRQTDVTLFESIGLHDRALTEHRKLHRNLSALTDGVHDVISEHGEALDTVREVVVQLNESVAEGKEQLDEAVTSQIQRHVLEIKGLRFIMRNVTSLLQTILSDRLKQDFALASMRMRQRSVLESIDNHAGSIDRINHDTTRIKEALNDAEITGEENGRRIENTMMLLTDHEHRIRLLDSTTYRLVDVTTILNASLSTQIDEVDEIERFFESHRDLLYNVAELLATQDEDLTTYKSNMQEIINTILVQQSSFYHENLQQNVTIEGLQNWSSDMTDNLYQIDTNVEFMDTRIDLIAAALGSIAYMEDNITDIRDDLADLSSTSDKNSRFTEDLSESITGVEEMLSILERNSGNTKQALEYQHSLLKIQLNDLNEFCTNSAEKVKHLSGRVDHFKDGVREKLDNTSSMTLELRQSVSDQQVIMTSMMNDVIQQRANVEGVLQKVFEHENVVLFFNRTILNLHRVTEHLKAKQRGHSSSIRSILQSVSDNEDLIQTIQIDYWDILSRLNEMSARTDDVVDQVSLFEAKFSGSRGRMESSMRELEYKVRQIASNWTEIVNRISFIEYDQDSAYNVTAALFDTIQEQTAQISMINQSLEFGAFDVYASIASTIAAIEESVYDVNDTLSRDLSGISALLVDFQLAFDTSGTLMERQNFELKILAANSSNYFDYFASTIDYLRQIVQQTSEAVGENRDRVHVLNGSVVFLQNAIPSLIRNNAAVNQTIATNTSAINNLEEENEGQQPDGILMRSTTREDNSEDREDYDDEREYDYAQVRGGSSKYFNIHEPGFGDASSAYGEYDLATLLDGDADQIRIARRMESMVDTSYTDDYDEQYDGYFAIEEEEK